MEREDLKAVNLQIVPADYYREEGINFWDICRILAVHRYKIILVTLVSTVSALLYAFLVPPLYQAEVYILPPSEQDIVDLNIAEDFYSTEQVYQEYRSKYNSTKIRLLFFKQNDLLTKLVEENTTDVDIYKTFDSKFNKRLEMTSSTDKLRQNLTILKFSASDAQLTAEFLNEFVSFINRYTVNLLKKNIEKKIINKKHQTMLKITNLIETSNRRKEDTIVILSEALKTAKALGIKNRIATIEESITSFKDERAENLLSRLGLGPIYNRGELALSAELDAIKSRENDAAFIVGLRELEEEISFYNGILDRLANHSNVEAVTIDQYAQIPQFRVKPNRKYIVFSGVFGGLTLGVIFVVMLSMLNRLRDLSKNELYE